MGISALTRWIGRCRPVAPLVSADQALVLGRDPRLQQRVEAALVRAEADDAGRVSPLRWVPIDLIAQAALLEAATARPTQAQLDDAIVRLTKRGR